MQKFVSQPTESGGKMSFCVAKINPNGTDYIPLKGELYPTREDAEARAAELNEEYKKECEELEKKDREESANNE